MRSPIFPNVPKASPSSNSTNAKTPLASPGTQIADSCAASPILAPFPKTQHSWLTPEIGQSNIGGTRCHFDPEPQSGRKLCELGLTYAALGETTASIEALRKATALRPELGMAWRKLADLLRQTGDVAGAKQADANYGDCVTTDASRIRMAKSPSAGKLAAAETRLRNRLCRATVDSIEFDLREHLRRNPTDASAFLVLSEVFIGQGRYPEAEQLLERAIEIVPDYTSARYNYAIALFRQHKAVLAVSHVRRLLADDRKHVRYRILLAGCLAKLSEFTQAIAVYEGLLKDDPHNASLRMSYSNVLKSVGRRIDAVQACRSCLQTSPTFGEAYLGLANLAVDSLQSTELAAMRLALASPGVPATDRMHVHYALGRILEEARDFANSFAHYAEGARLKRSQIAYDAGDTAERVQRATELFTPDFFAARSRQRRMESSHPVPIFVVGLPRSGTTLIEQILASHSAIEGTMELPDIDFIAGELGDRPGRAHPSDYPESLASLSGDDLAALGERYIERTNIYRKTQRPYFIDKMPSNWAHLGLIHTILPQARIIDARRHPIATCFGAFKRCFAYGQYFSYELNELGRYFNDYVRMMNHFGSVLPGRVHRVEYETIVVATGAEIHRLFAYLNLEVEDGCLHFWETERPVSTASSEQVRQPIYRGGLDQWRNYEPWLAPLKATLHATPDLDGRFESPDTGTD